MSRGLTLSAWLWVFPSVYLAVLPMAGTIALRNLLLLLLLLLALPFYRSVRLARPSALAILVWAGYLLAFSWFNQEGQGIAGHVFSHWGKGLLAGIAGAGLAVALSQDRRISVFSLGVVSFFPILLHLCLLVWRVLAEWTIPWGYWGREAHHADLGYAAGQTLILLAAAWVAPGVMPAQRRWIVLLVILCFVSLSVAQSRAGLVFGFIAVSLVLLTVSLSQIRRMQIRHLWGLMVAVLIGATVWFFASQSDGRWRDMADKLEAGMLGDPLVVLCHGTESIEPLIVARHGVGDKAERIIASVRNGDGSRMLVLRASLALALKHPWGSDGSRQAFQHLLRQECAEPRLPVAHAHNGWLDMTLAIGWPAAAIYLVVLSSFCWLGLQHVRTGPVLNPWAVVLTAVSLFWIVRGWTDSVFRDHMLEMQGFVLGWSALMLGAGRGLSASDSAEAPAQPTAQTRGP